MPLWGSVDNAANSDIAVLMQVKLPVNSANQTLLFGNTTMNAFIQNEAVGQFGVSAGEIQASNDAGTGHPQHSGWVIRHEGRGLKAGRVWYETMVAMSSLTGDANSGEDTYFPDYSLKITTQPRSNTSASIQNIAFTVAATSTPSGATITYSWQRYNGGSWVNVANVAGQYFDNTSPTFTANNATANGNVFRVLVSATGANTVASGNATISYIV